MIAIPNMEKPKSCSKCRWWDTCSVLYDYFDGSVYEYSYEDILDSELDEKCHSDCPIIEIIPCKECKFSHMTYGGQCKYCDLTLDDDDNYIECYFDGDHFCGFGERAE